MMYKLTFALNRILHSYHTEPYERLVPAWRRPQTLAVCLAFSLAPFAHSGAAQSPADNGSASATAVAADAKPAAPLIPLQKPAWVTDFSFGVKESYDDNVLMVSGKGPLDRQESWVTTVSAKVGFNFAPLLGDQKILQVVGLGYAPDFVTYHDAAVESYTAHRFANTLKGGTDAFSFNLENSFNYIDGSQSAPIYPGDDRFRSGFASVAPRERRRQTQDRAKAVFQYDWGTFFFRPTAALLDYDMMTDLRATSGYQNYPSRSDVNGGGDFGYRLSDDLAVTLGYRYGHQDQERMAAAIDAYRFASVNDYQRALVGLEGKPWKWLTFSMQGGPDFRSYADTAAVEDRHPVTYYGEAAVTVDASPSDTVAFKYKQWQFVAFGGRLPYFDSSYELSYRRKVTKQITLDLTGRIASYDFTCGSDPNNANLRNDYLYSVSPGLTYAFTPNLSVNAAYLIELGRNVQDNPPGGADYREFDHNVASLAATYKF